MVPSPEQQDTGPQEFDCAVFDRELLGRLAVVLS